MPNSKSLMGGHFQVFFAPKRPSILGFFGGMRGLSPLHPLIHVGVVPFHRPRGVGKRCEPVLRIKRLCVSRHQHPSPQALQVGVGVKRAHHLMGNAAVTVRYGDEHIAKVGICGAVSHNARKTGQR